MVKRSALMFVLLAALLAGCAGADSADTSGDDAGSAATPAGSSSDAGAASCEELADELIAQLQVIVNELSDATLEDLGNDDLLAADTQQQLDDLEGRVESAGCDDEEMDRLLTERADRIEGGGFIADAVREGLSENGDLPF